MIGGTYEYLISSLPDLYFQNTDEAKSKVLGLLDKYAHSSSGQSNAIVILDNEVEKFLPASLFSTFHRMNLKNIHEDVYQNSKSKVLSTFSRYRYDLLEKLQVLRSSPNKNAIKTQSNLEELLKTGTPLEIEIKLMKHQWQKLEEFSVGHLSDFETIFAYKIKLLLLQRWWSFDQLKGFEIFEKLTFRGSIELH